MKGPEFNRKDQPLGIQQKNSKMLTYSWLESLFSQVYPESPVLVKDLLVRK